MKRTGLSLLLTLTLPAALASADPISHRKAAIELLEVTNSQKLTEQMAASVQEMMKQQFASMDLSPEASQTAERMQKETLDWFAQIFSWEKMRDTYVDIYIDVFSEAEIRELIAFYRSPLGVKMLDRMPQLMQKSMDRTQALLQETLPKLQERMRKNLAEIQEKYEG